MRPWGLPSRDAQIEDLIHQAPTRDAKVEIALRIGLQHALFRHYTSTGDEARDSKRWPEAYLAYSSALDVIPYHTGYIIQAAHCLKEYGQYEAAELYYRSALVLGVDYVDVRDHLDHVMYRNRFAAVVKTKLGNDVGSDNVFEKREAATVLEILFLLRGFGLLGWVTIDNILEYSRANMTISEVAAELVREFWSHIERHGSKRNVVCGIRHAGAPVPTAN
jgi:tetratricopeptide (TPR) repeat protein